MNGIFFGELAGFVREEFHRANINAEFFTLAHCDLQRYLSKMRKRTIVWNPHNKIPVCKGIRI